MLQKLTLLSASIWFVSCAETDDFFGSPYSQRPPPPPPPPPHYQQSLESSTIALAEELEETADLHATSGTRLSQQESDAIDDRLVSHQFRVNQSHEEVRPGVIRRLREAAEEIRSYYPTPGQP